METAVIVKVAVSAAPYSIDKPYDYLVPAELLEKAVPGVRVTVPFGKGNRESEGIILARETGEKAPGLKALKSLLDQEPVLDQDGEPVKEVVEIMRKEMDLWQNRVVL